LKTFDSFKEWKDRYKEAKWENKKQKSSMSIN
jgi:hypothetical protein